jgi:hypothetical protein
VIESQSVTAGLWVYAVSIKEAEGSEVETLIEVWPKPDDAYQIKIEGPMVVGPFTKDADRASFDSRLILLYAVAFGKAHLNRKDAKSAMDAWTMRLQRIKSNQHGTRRYIRENPNNLHPDGLPQPRVVGGGGSTGSSGTGSVGSPCTPLPPDTSPTVPAALDLGVVYWTTGEDVSFSLLDVTQGASPEPYIRFTQYSISSALPLDVVLTESNGDLTGVIQEFQGGTYILLFQAETASGATTFLAMEARVGLEITAPVWDTIPDPDDLVQGALFPGLAVNLYVSYSGNPAGGEPLVFSEDSTVLAALGLTMTGNGTLYGLAAVDAPIGAHVVAVRVANSAGLSAVQTFTVTILAATGAIVPQSAGVWSGNPGCGAVAKPAWASSAIYSIPLSDTTEHRDDLLSHLATDPAEVTDIRLSGTDTVLPGFNVIADILDADFGWLIGTHQEIGEVTKTFKVEAQSASGWSDPSPVFTQAVWDDTMPEPPVLLSISGVEGSNDLRLNFDRNVYTKLGTDASYFLDWLFEVNPVTPAVYRNPVGLSGQGTSQLTVTLDGNAFTAGNTLRASYTE